MPQESPSQWTSTISDITPEGIYIRGYPMQSLSGRLSFSAITFLIVRGHMPSPGQSRMMDVILSSILDYALQKSGTVAARAIVSVNPQMTAGLSTAMLGAGKFAVSPEHAGTFIASSFSDWKESGLDMERFAERLVTDMHAAKKRIPGFGHQIFRGTDPRAEHLREIAQKEGVWGEKNEWYCTIHHTFKRIANKPDIVMNDVGMLASIMSQMGFTPPEMTGLALLSTFPGVIAHVSEEMDSGIINRIIPDENAEYSHSRRDLDRDLTAAGWE